MALEHGSGSLIFQLGKFPHLVLYPVHPTMAAKYREAFYPSGSKSDPNDTGLILDLVVHHRDRLRRLEPDDEPTRLLQMLVEQRRKLVDEKTRLSNRLTAWLKIYFPQVLDWVDDIDSALGCALLQRWPTLQQLQHAHPGTLSKFFREHNSRSEKRIEERIQAIYQATPAVTDSALLQGGTVIAASWVALIQTLQEQIARVDRAIEPVASQHADASLFGDLPGAGPVLRPRLIAAFGSRRDRYTAAHQLQSYSGISPITVQSGKSEWVHFRWACPKFLRQTFHEFAAHSIAKSAWARAYYDSQIAQHKEHHAAVRALAYKWIRVLYRCWKDHIPYSEEVYIKALQKHNSPVFAALSTPKSRAASAPTRVKWETVSGFHKLSAENS